MAELSEANLRGTLQHGTHLSVHGSHSEGNCRPDSLANCFHEGLRRNQRRDLEAYRPPPSFLQLRSQKRQSLLQLCFFGANVIELLTVHIQRFAISCKLVDGICESTAGIL